MLMQVGPELPPIATAPMIEQAIAARAWFAFSLSGGKDSTMAAFAAMRYLDRAGHPRARRLAIHADLGRAEWDTTPDMVETVAAMLGLPLLVVRRQRGDMVARWEQRFADGKARYEALEIYNLIGPWSSAQLRFCTSEMKAQVIGPALARRYPGETIVSVIGIRREESASRRHAPVACADLRFANTGNRHGTSMLTWHPLADWTARQVFDAHARHRLPLHEAYRVWHADRLSCRFCVLASLASLPASVVAPVNHAHFLHLVAMEAASTFSFQPGRWLADIAPDLLPPALARDIERAKRDAAHRRALEASLPSALRFVKGWPPRLPTPTEARRIAKVRGTILARHDLANLYPEPRDIIARFGALLAQKG